MGLYAKLAAVQSEMQVPKNLWNNFGKYNYRNAETILNAFKPLGVKYNAVLFVFDEAVVLNDWHYIKATATFVDLETNETIITTAYAREESTKKGMDASQISGTASSYARKYALNGLFLLDDVKDADTPEHDENIRAASVQGDKGYTKTTQPSRANPKPSTSQNRTNRTSAQLDQEAVMHDMMANETFECLAPEEVRTLESELKRTGVSRKKMLDNFHCECIVDMRPEQYHAALRILKGKPSLDPKN